MVEMSRMGVGWLVKK